MLARTVRFACPVDERDTDDLDRRAETTHDTPRDNAFAAWPASDQMALHGEFIVEVVGHPDPETGYLVSVSDLDAVVRTTLLPMLRRSLRERPTPPLPRLLRDGIDAIGKELTIARSDSKSVPIAVGRLTLAMGRYFRLQMDADTMNECLLRQSFEFSAAHRLHCPQLDDRRNREIFGKCNNPNGHGHNYRLEVAVRVPLDADGALRVTLAMIERAVRESVIDHLDHQHLNEDIAYFERINPSVEHIAAYCRQRLTPVVADLGGRLTWLTLWETEKTACTVGEIEAGGITELGR